MAAYRTVAFPLLLAAACVFSAAGFAQAARKSRAAPAAKSGGRAPLPVLSRDPYAGAIVVDVATGKTIYESNPDVKGYPASIVKLMDLLIVLERVDAGALSLTNRVVATAEATRMGGSQVYLKEHETFTVDEMLYAIMVQSANDAALALALHVGGTREGFLEMMNRKARELGMTATEFHSPHGLPPAAGEQPDVSTPRDLARLGLALVRRKDVLKYTGTREHGFRSNTMQMLNHNHLLGAVPGCDGLKTGYIAAAGFSIIATAERNGRRVVAVVLGSQNRRTRDDAAAKMLSAAFANLPPLPPPAQAGLAAPPAEASAAAGKEPAAKRSKGRGWKRGAVAVAAGVGIAWAVIAILRQPPRFGGPRRERYGGGNFGGIAK